jgi:transposase
VAIPGIGPVTATAVIAAIGNGAHSTGGHQKLLGISKRGNSYLRRLSYKAHVRSWQQRTKQSPGLRAWLALAFASGGKSQPLGSG